MFCFVCYYACIVTQKIAHVWFLSLVPFLPVLLAFYLKLWWSGTLINAFKGTLTILCTFHLKLKRKIWKSSLKTCKFADRYNVTIISLGRVFQVETFVYTKFTLFIISRCLIIPVSLFPLTILVNVFFTQFLSKVQSSPYSPKQTTQAKNEYTHFSSCAVMQMPNHSLSEEKNPKTFVAVHGSTRRFVWTNISEKKSKLIFTRTMYEFKRCPARKITL